MVSNKETAKLFLQAAASGRVNEAYAQFVAPDFIHHNQYFKGDRQSLMEAMTEAHKGSPNKNFEIRQIFEEGNTVITHSLVTRQKPQEMNIAVFENAQCEKCHQPIHVAKNMNYPDRKFYCRSCYLEFIESR